MKITISRRAEKDIDQLAEYLEKQWSEKVKNQVLTDLRDKVLLVAENPKMCETLRPIPTIFLLLQHQKERNRDHHRSG